MISYLLCFLSLILVLLIYYWAPWNHWKVIQIHKHPTPTTMIPFLRGVDVGPSDSYMGQDAFGTLTPATASDIVMNNINLEGFTYTLRNATIYFKRFQTFYATDGEDLSRGIIMYHRQAVLDPGWRTYIFGGDRQTWFRTRLGTCIYLPTYSQIGTSMDLYAVQNLCIDKGYLGFNYRPSDGMYECFSVLRV